MSQKNKVSQEGPDVTNNLFYRKSDLTSFSWKEFSKMDFSLKAKGFFGVEILNESWYVNIFFIKFGLGVDAEFWYHKTQMEMVFHQVRLSEFEN